MRAAVHQLGLELRPRRSPPPHRWTPSDPELWEVLLVGYQEAEELVRSRHPGDPAAMLADVASFLPPTAFRLTKAQVDAGAEGWAGRLTLLRHYLSQECPA